MLYFLVKFVHVLGAVVVLGTGTGIAFFMLMAHRTRDAAFIARTASVVVIADAIFTLSAVLLQPLTGGLLMMLSATPITERWLLASLALYIFAGLFWVPVIFMQIEMRDLARKAADQCSSLPERYFILFRRWFAFGFPGFGATMLILWLMIAKSF
ncbi:putative membrane protein [Bradyrhizobium sp. USDA 4486]